MTEAALISRYRAVMVERRDAHTAPHDSAGCARMFAELSASAAKRAPIYARLAAGIAADDRLAGLLLMAPPTQRNPVLLLACVHDLLLADPLAPLARFYPNLTSEPDRGDPVPDLLAFCDFHRVQLADLLRTRSTQTNEVGRCATLLPVLGLVADEIGPLAHLDVGASAGLNLLLDRYHYDYEPGGRVGDPSPVTLVCGTRGSVPVPPAVPPIVARRGIDRAPVDIADADQTRWLEACVWPDQTDRFQRLRSALTLARSAAPDVRVGDAVADVAEHVEDLALHGHPVVTNTWVLNYLTGADRTAYVAALDALGRRLDMSWVYTESPYLTPELPGPRGDASVERTVVVLVRWRAGRRRVDHVADTHPHGYWLHWAA